MAGLKKILIVGGGGREHALAWKLQQSPKVCKIFVAPGNAGTAEFCENLPVGVMEFEKLTGFARREKIDLAAVAPDDPLVGGLVDEFQKTGIRAWGAGKQAARIEGSKAFAKQLMQAENIPTAGFQIFTDFTAALAYVKEKGAPIVIKASGLALGKGVAVCRSAAEAEDFLKKIFVEKIFGRAGQEVVVEEFLAGPEISIHAFCDGQSFVLFPPAQDHKQIFEGDKGPNTGGMGTVAPLPWVTQNLLNEIKLTIVEPALKGLQKQHSTFSGLLYPGLIITPSSSLLYEGENKKNTSPPWQGGDRVGEPKVLEFNARFGDPETQSYMRLLKTDLYDIFEASVEGKLSELRIEWESQYACCIVLASGGYPGNYEKGKVITGVEQAQKLDDIVVFHAGTAFSSPPPRNSGGSFSLPLAKGGIKGGLVTAAGRVLGVTATGGTLQSALDKAYAAVRLIHFDGMHYRKDIGVKALWGNR